MMLMLKLTFSFPDYHFLLVQKIANILVILLSLEVQLLNDVLLFFSNPKHWQIYNDNTFKTNVQFMVIKCLDTAKPIL